MQGRLKKIWKNRGLILEGIINSVIIKEEVERVALHRESICLTCPHYDKDGSSENAYIKGSPACSVCGCNISFLTHSMSAVCSLEEQGQQPKWLPELSEHEEKTLIK